MATKSNKPKGLKITRNGNKFICEWDIPSDKYEEQQFKSSPGGSSSVTKTATKKTVTVSLNTVYSPNKSTIASVWFEFSVRGKSKGKSWSEWSTEKFNLYAPENPVLSKELTAPNVCKFSWRVPSAGPSYHHHFKQVLFQTKLVKDCTWKAAEDDWKNADQYTYSSSESSKTITEDTATLAQGNYSRLVRVMAQGCAGNSEWKYIRQDYGKAAAADQTDGEVKETEDRYNFTDEWDTDEDRSKPVKEYFIEWTIATPQSDMSCPTGQTWTEVWRGKDTNGKGGANYDITTKVTADKCLYTRINTVNDAGTTVGTAKLRVVGPLSMPTALSVENVSQEAQTAKITATNNSAVSGTVLEVIYRKNGSDTIVGLITGNPNYLTVKCPAWDENDSVSFGVRAVLPKTTSSKTESGVTIYTIDPYMTSEILWQSGSVAVAPGSLSLSKAEEDIRVTWTNNWSDANLIELSWSDNPNAWESTDQPDTFTIDNPFATSWRIAGCETGKTWYVRLRAIQDTGDGKIYSPYSNMAQINLASSPSVPTLVLSQGLIAKGQGFTASWEYTSNDGTPQAAARIYSYASNAYTQIGEASTEEYIDLPGWDTTGTRQLCVEVVSESGKVSGKSGMISITVADAPTCSMTNSLESVTDTDKGTYKVLTELPFEVEVTGAGTGGTTSVMIRRRESYHIEKPDESDREGFEGEIVYDKSIAGAADLDIGIDDLLGSLDDGGKYTVIAQVKDNIGQVATVEEDFDVEWSHQALELTGDVVIDEDAMIASITPIAPSGAISSDRCDIYRLSADKPALVYKGAEFGVKYVDPYPTIGDNGGYRLVFVTAEGDYKTSGNVYAFYDAKDDHLYSNKTIIDFDGNRAELGLDLDISSDWVKDFVQKKYLGGSTRGYWRAGVGRNTDINVVAIPDYEEDIITIMRALSEYLGDCHIRTPEGSSYPANVKVTESWDGDKAGKVAKFNMKITRIEQKKLDGMTYAEWIGGQ